MITDLFNILIFSCGAFILLVLVIAFFINLMDYVRIRREGSQKSRQRSQGSFYDY